MSASPTARDDLAWQQVTPIAAVFAALIVGTAFVQDYGYMADELYFLSCTDRLAWGYVDFSPFSIAVMAAFRALIGDSLLAIRLIPALVSVGTLAVLALLTRELGGGRSAQSLAVLAWVSAPAVQAVASYHSMNVIEALLWSLAAWLVARELRRPAPGNWTWLGVVLGVALLNKVSTLWLGFGLAVGLVLTPERRRLRGLEPWWAMGIAALLFSPHVAWQILNDWPLIDFYRGFGEEVAVTGDVLASPLDFVAAQVVGMNPLAAPLWVAGLIWYFKHPDGRPFRALGWTWLCVFAMLMLSGRSQAYYLTPAFPILLAAGGIWAERAGRERRWLVPSAAACFVAGALFALPLGMPILPPSAFEELQRRLDIPDTDGELPMHLHWRVGWEDVADAVAGVHAAISARDPGAGPVGVLAIGFPTAGALERFGPERGLPPVVSTHNNYWLWGPGPADSEVMLIVARPGHPVLSDFADVTLGAEIPCRFCEGEIRQERVFVARGPSRPISELWPSWRDYR